MYFEPLKVLAEKTPFLEFSLRTLKYSLLPNVQLFTEEHRKYALWDAFSAPTFIITLALILPLLSDNLAHLSAVKMFYPTPFIVMFTWGAIVFAGFFAGALLLTKKILCKNPETSWHLESFNTFLFAIRFYGLTSALVFGVTINGAGQLIKNGDGGFIFANPEIALIGFAALSWWLLTNPIQNHLRISDKSKVSQLFVFLVFIASTIAAGQAAITFPHFIDSKACEQLFAESPTFFEAPIDEFRISIQKACDFSPQ